MFFIGRAREKLLLRQMLDSSRSEFIVVFGRRRIGKTYLIESFLLEQNCPFFQVVGAKEGTMQEQLKEFSKEIGRVFYGNARMELPKTWMQAFEMLHTAINYQPSEHPIVLFFDEFPWMATKRSRLLSTLEYYWNRYFKNNSRITRQISLKPFDLLETKKFLDHQHIVLNERQILEIYSVIGGIPYYLEKFEKTLSLAQNVNALCFRKEGLLFDEFHKLLSSLFTDDTAYEELLRIIASSRYGVNRAEIKKKTKETQNGGTLTTRLNDLEMAGFIKAFLPVGHTKRGIYYRVIDEYILFYLEWIAPEKQMINLKIKGSQFWLEKRQSQSYSIWLEYVFESICYKHIAQIKSISCFPLDPRHINNCHKKITINDVVTNAINMN